VNLDLIHTTVVVVVVKEEEEEKTKEKKKKVKEEKKKGEKKKKTPSITNNDVYYIWEIFLRHVSIKTGHCLLTQVPKYIKKNYCTISCLNLNEI
jgi:hypothetical protein